MDLPDYSDLHARIDAHLVEWGAAEIRAKLEKSRAKGRAGWSHPNAGIEEGLQRMLQDHVQKANPGNYVDIATLALMLHWRDVFDGEFPYHA